ncbi:MAG TPA: aminotransferase class I/II-fold pyridoxal phosphate-dependent enzyme [Ilumatobacteraceae bacterium]|nr:aminotransferase class I/II-fold pyridoxal phosphate-dependent enzyme [Ilumatobacteraceae bacterium]
MQWKIYLSPPEMSTVERGRLLDAFDSNWIAPAGPDLDAFEASLCELSGASAAIGLSSGTAALHLALEVVGVGPGDDVLMSDLTFAASAFAAGYLGARPCFVDSEPSTWQMDPDLLEEELTRRAASGALPAAVVSVDLYGSVADNSRIAEVCARYDVPLVEDAAEAVGASRDGVAAGRFGRVGIYSFNGNKIVTTGGGGALVTDDLALAKRVRYLSTQSREAVPHYEHREIGRNYRMGNVNAAIGRGQLDTLAERIEQRRRVQDHYRRCLADLPGVSFQAIPDGCAPNYWLTTVQLDPDEFGATPADILAALRSEAIEARPGFMPMHLQPVFAGAPTVGGAVTERHFASSVSLPSSGRLSSDDVQQIVDVVLSVRR